MSYMFLFSLLLFFTLGISNAKGFKKDKLRYAKKAGMAVSPPPGHYYYHFLYPWMHSSQGLKAKKIKAGLTIGPERHRSRKCRAEEQS